MCGALMVLLLWLRLISGSACRSLFACSSLVCLAALSPNEPAIGSLNRRSDRSYPCDVQQLAHRRCYLGMADVAQDTVTILFASCAPCALSLFNNSSTMQLDSLLHHCKALVPHCLLFCRLNLFECRELLYLWCCHAAACVFLERRKTCLNPGFRLA
jgi:hypothetical protein